MMKRFQRRAMLLATVTVACFLSSGVSAQKSAPPRAQEPAPRVPDLVKWADAYDRAREPVILVLVGWATGDVTAGGVGQGILNRDTTGFAQSLKAEFERALLQGEAQPDFIDQEALNQALDRISGVLEMGGEDDAIRLLALHSGADLVITIELYGKPGSPPTRVMGRTIDMSRGRVVGRFPSFQWQLGTDAPAVRQYANAFAQSFVDDFDRFIRPSRRYTLQILGAGGLELQEAIREYVEQVPGVVRVRAQRAASTGGVMGRGQESSFGLAVTYDDDALRLAVAAKRIIESLGQFRVEEREIMGESITLRLYHYEEYIEEAAACDAAILRDGSGGEATRSELRSLYEVKNQPKIVVLVNRRPTPEEEREANVPPSSPGSVNAENVILITTAGRDVVDGGAGARPHADRGDGEFDPPGALRIQANLIETAMLELLGVRHLRLDTVDAEEARRIIASEAAKQGGVYRESEMTRILARQNISDIAIYGMGDNLCSGNRRTVTYTFRAVNVHNARLLGTAIVSRPFDADFDRQVRGMAEEAVGRLVCDLMATWRPPSNIGVTIKRLDGPEDFRVLEDQIKASPLLSMVGSENYDSSPGTGIVTFRLDYACSFSELKREFERIINALPYTLNTESSSDSAFTFAIQRDG
jgi:hypothetical protein